MIVKIFFQQHAAICLFYTGFDKDILSAAAVTAAVVVPVPVAAAVIGNNLPCNLIVCRRYGIRHRYWYIVGKHPAAA